MSNQVKYYYTSKGNRPESLEDSAILVDSFNKLFVTHGVTFNFNNIIEHTYDELKEMITNSKLESGQRYRITDYATTTIQDNTTSAGNVFDLIVEAISQTKLSESAFAVLHDEDEYFLNSELSAWDIKYCFDNDTSRFAWADTENGKGVIYYLKDEFGNICHYDFKNIQFTKDDVSYYTFNYNDSDCTLNNFEDCSNDCVNNIIEAYYNGNVQYLNNIIIKQTSSDSFPKNNEFGNDCYNLTIGDKCIGNEFGTDYHDKECGDSFVYNNCEYVSNAEDNWKTEKVGGIDQGLDKSKFANMSVSEVLDMILYPTINPTVNPTPYASISYSNTLIEVGTTLPASTLLKPIYSRGIVNYTNADGNTFYTGDKITESWSADWFGTTSEEKQYKVTYTVTLDKGPELLNNKGQATNTTTNGSSYPAPYPGGTKTSNEITITAVYPYYANTTTITEMTKQTVINYFTSNVTAEILIPDETANNKFELHVPTTVTIESIKQLNTINNKYDIDVSMVSKETTTYNNMTYNVYVRTDVITDMQGPSKYQIKFKKG